MEVIKEASTAVTDASSELAAKRTDYYQKWDKFADDSVKKSEKEEEEDKKKAAEALGLNKDEPKSEAEKKDREKREALKAAKKLWDDKKLSEAAARLVVGDGHDGKEVVVDDSLLNGKGVVHFKGGKNSKYTVPSKLGSRLVKFFIEDCENCSFDLEAVTISQHVEISHCTDCKVHVKAPQAILQVDVCKSLEVRYAVDIFDPKSHKIFHAGVSESVFHVHHGEGVKSLDIDYIRDGAAEVHQKTKEEHQFVSHFQDGQFVTEEVFRSKGNMPLTAKEIREAEEKGDGDGLQCSERAAELKKIGGNEAFSEGNYAQAAIFYTEAIDQSPPDSKIIPVCFANRSFAYLKMGHLAEALKDAEDSLKADPQYCKALFRKGLALHALKRYHEACRALSQALDMEPKNQSIKQALGFAEMRARKQEP